MICCSWDKVSNPSFPPALSLGGGVTGCGCKVVVGGGVGSELGGGVGCDWALVGVAVGGGIGLAPEVHAPTHEENSTGK
jgi:hypothetical protein